MENINIINDLSVLTTIPESVILKLFKKEIFCICEAVEEDILNDKSISCLNLGIGLLCIKHDIKDQIQYKFIPGTLLEKSINNTVANKQNLLEDVLNESLAKKFIDVYKNLC